MKSRLLHTLICLLIPAGLHADPITDQVKTMVPSIKEWLNSEVVINSIKQQNEKHADLQAIDIDKLDKQWATETKSTNQPLINQVLSNDLSLYLKSVKTASNSGYTEIFVMDDKGLNVGQSDITSDYWQGDEDKWKNTYLAGPDGINISKVKLDESTNTHQAQLSITIVDPATGGAIGAATIGINVNAVISQLTPK